MLDETLSLTNPVCCVSSETCLLHLTASAAAETVVVSQSDPLLHESLADTMPPASPRRSVGGWCCRRTAKSAWSANQVVLKNQTSPWSCCAGCWAHRFWIFRAHDLKLLFVESPPCQTTILLPFIIASLKQHRTWLDFRRQAANDTEIRDIALDRLCW